MIAPDAAAQAAMHALALATAPAAPAATTTNEDTNVNDTVVETVVDATPGAAEAIVAAFAPTAPVVDGATVENAAPEVEAAAAAKPEEMPRYVAVTMTTELWDRIQETLPTNAAVGTYLRDIVAEKLGVTVVAKTRSRYASPEEKAVAQKAARVERADLIKALLAEHKAKLAESK